MESVLAYLASRAMQNRGQFVDAPDAMSRIADLVGLINAGKGAFKAAGSLKDTKIFQAVKNSFGNGG